MPRTTFLNRRRAPDHGHSTVQGCFPGRSGDMSCETARVNAIGPGSPRDHTAVVSRLVDAGSTDDRMLAALLWVSRQTRSGSEADRSGRPHTVTTLERRDSWSGSNALAGGARLPWGGTQLTGSQKDAYNSRRDRKGARHSAIARRKLLEFSSVPPGGIEPPHAV
jgi:hypothetical protein